MTNPFLRASTLSDEYPPFDLIRFEHFRPAFEAGMAEQLREIEEIAATPASFATTVEGLERSGAILRRVSQVFDNLCAADGDERFHDLDAELAPLRAAHADAISQHAGLFARVREVHEARHTAGLTPEQVNLVERIHTDFVRAGAALSPAAKAELAELNARLAELASTYSSHLLKDNNDLAVLVDDLAQLDGLAPDSVESARQAAADRGLDGYLLTLSLFTNQPWQEVLADRGLRRRIHEASVARGRRGNQWDTRATLVEIAAVRARRAALLGYPSHAAYVVADETAGTTEAVTDRLLPMVGPAVRNLDAVAAELTEALHADGHEGPLQPWDWSYYYARRTAERHSLDLAELRAFLPLPQVRDDGVFAAASALYGLSFTRREDLPPAHPDIEVYDVADDTGRHLGLVACDWFARDTKQGGAWMWHHVPQSRLLGTRPVVTLTMNVPKPPPGQPALMTIDEVETAFHEFGHVLHGLLSDCGYPRTSMTNVPRDFVEFPSQVNEMWAFWPGVIDVYARHHETGEPLAAEVVERLLASRHEQDPYDTVEILAATLVDWAWHLHTDPVAAEEVDAFEAAALERYGLRHPIVPPRYGSTYFKHVFADAEGYAAGYYSYLWAEVLDADTVSWFEENGGLLRGNGERFRAILLSRGGTVDVLAATAELLGREPRVEPLLRRRGLL
ncbi:M3 family metallopeptidase [Nocardioides sp.]|uniref:M3 family metallopeptidase n=1 Tax=Nocardioides sp. TaxID=35761 RepID=UPI0039E5736B